MRKNSSLRCPKGCRAAHPPWNATVSFQKDYLILAESSYSRQIFHLHGSWWLLSTRHFFPQLRTATSSTVNTTGLVLLNSLPKRINRGQEGELLQCELGSPTTATVARQFWHDSSHSFEEKFFKRGHLSCRHYGTAPFRACLWVETAGPLLTLGKYICLRARYFCAL